MIGKVMTGASFYHCISYCLEDKKELSREQKIKLSELDQLQHLGRAEVLEYNNCFGNKKELTEQFMDVRKLSKRVEKPVLHLTLRLASGDSLRNDQWMEIGRECAKEFGVADNQYLTILHRDASEPHIHIVANRVGFDGRAAKDGNSYKRMAELCRRIEKQYGLREVLSPNAFLPKEERRLKRKDSRHEKLGADLQKALQKSRDYAGFEQQMKALGYQIIKGRGIAFIDEKKVRIKGSEAGFSLAKIERLLGENRKTKTTNDNVAAQQNSAGKSVAALGNSIPKFSDTEYHRTVEQNKTGMITELLHAENESNPVPFELSGRSRKKKKRTPKR